MDGKPSCTYCQEDIVGPGVQCCECPDFDICLQCFSSGAEIGPHKNNHSYRLLTHKNDVPKEETSNNIFGGRSNWTGREHLQLLDAMDQCGFGNWEYVADLIKTKTAEEVREEYVSRYLNGTVGQVTWNEIGDYRPILPEHTPQDRGPLAPEITSRLPPIDVTPEEARELGYMPHRDDFIREYDTQAEELVSSLQLKMNEESEEEMALKLAQVDMYTRRLRERCRRKRVVRDYQLIAKFYATQRKEVAAKKHFTKEQKDLRDNMRVFSQFLTSGEHERLTENIEKERELRHRLDELLKYRSLGLLNQEEIVHYEQHMAYQQQQQLRQNRPGSSGYRAAQQEHRYENGRSEKDQSSTEGKYTELRDDVLYNNNSASSNSETYELKVKAAPPDDTSELSVKDIVTRYLSVSGWLPGLFK